MNTVYSQYTICDCCSSSLSYISKKEDSIFNPKLIKERNISELTVRVTSKQMAIIGKDTSFTVVDKEYNEDIFKFNKAGYIERKIHFNRLGQFHSVYEYTRDLNNRIIKIVFHYLDSVGDISGNFDMPETTDYIYSNERLVKTKKRDYDQNIQPDSKSIYLQYEYDSKSRVTKEYNHYYFDESSKVFIFTTQIKYNDTSNIVTGKTYQNNKLFTTRRTTFNSDQQPIISTFYDKNNKQLQQENYYRNNQGLLLKASIRSYSGMFTECPDKGNYTNTYQYNSMGLIEIIRHQYKTTECTIRFIYK